MTDVGDNAASGPSTLDGREGSRASVALLSQQPHRTWKSWVLAITPDRIPTLEAVLGVVLVVGIGLAIPGQWGFLDLHPHPLWIVVLAIALRYGVPAGYVAGGVAAISYGLLAWSRPSAPVGSFTERDLVEPFLLLLAGVVVSELVSGQVRRLADLELRYGRVVEELQRLSERHVATLQVKGELEKRIVDQPSSIATLYRAGKRLQRLSVSELYAATLELVLEFVEAQACALYLYREDELRLEAGRPDVVPFRPVKLAPSGLAGEAIKQRRVVTIRDRLLQGAREALATEQVLMAGPLLDSDGQVLGLVVVERLDFLKFTPTNARLFGLVLEWASDALRNARMYERARDHAIEDDASGTYTAAHTMRRLVEEVQRARRYQLPLSVVEIQVGGLDLVEEQLRPALVRQLGLLLLRSVRAVDIVGRHTDPDKFVLILPLKSIEGAHIVAQRVLASTRAAELPLPIHVSVSSPSPEADASDGLPAVKAPRRRRYAVARSTAPRRARAGDH